MDDLELLLSKVKRKHWWSPPLLFVSVLLAIICLLLTIVFIHGFFGHCLGWGTTAEDRMGYAFEWGAAIEAIPIVLCGLICSVVGWKWGDSPTTFMCCSVVHLAFLVGILLTITTYLCTGM